MNTFLLTMTIRFIHRFTIRQTDCNGSRYIAGCSLPNLYLTKDICVTTEIVHYGGQPIHDLPSTVPATPLLSIHVVSKKFDSLLSVKLSLVVRLNRRWRNLVSEKRRHLWEKVSTLQVKLSPRWIRYELI